MLTSVGVMAQQGGTVDTLKKAPRSSHTVSDTLRSVKDSTVKAVKTLAGYQRSQLQSTLTPKKQELTSLPGKATAGFTDSSGLNFKKTFKGILKGKPSLLRDDSLRISLKNPFNDLLKAKPLVKLNSGYVSYQFNYRSAIDTPFVEKDITQHNLTGHLNVSVAGHLPVRVTFWSRQSNSSVFRDITDVQASFDGAAFQQQLQSSLKNRLMVLAPSLRDSLAGRLYALKKMDLNGLKSDLQQFKPQDLAEAHEIINVPRITWNPQLPDSLNRAREDSLKVAAKLLLDLYGNTKGAYDSLSKKVDSLKTVYDESLAKVQRFKNMLNGKWDELINTRQWTDRLKDYGMSNVQVPAKYQWLMGLRQFSLGRNVSNYSELTIKNTSINGINFEYNSWYYLAVTAGLVDYRYRDFAINGFNKKPQYFAMLRAGVGRLENNYLIASVFQGQKQLFPSNGSKISSITVTGISLEGRMRLNPTTFVTAEVAKSLSPDFRHTPSQGSTKLSLGDNSNLAYAFKAQSTLPATGTRLEGYYKHTGANYQSFSSFQTNAALESWSVKAEQGFFKRRLRLTASLRRNEFTNPFLQQDYNSNTVFKSLTASFRMRKWPVITIGYQPMSQLTAIDSQVVENRFQVLNATGFHTYKLGSFRTASTLVIGRFYNTSRDTGFVYYNATNVFWAQQFFFTAFAAQTSVSFTQNSGYRLVVLEEGIQLNLKKLGSVGLGVKINNLNDEVFKSGAYVNANIRVYKQDFITLSYDRGYLPGFHKNLVRNEMATVQFVKSFGFQ
ncbi:hypothetical protein [Paraflavitalea sp. CAU 1676]|uniref:hypothetical protein n=1 Tax=Paraflavitalea sp. CAU 1676 TaxID=3032598 RepID=UPI0023D9CCA0|nr:hypothetical protein [Paraflavitalea sp. CAU 1676]MDF2188421.1 hypothetical protein [Paraflavitalea sp. CAU 1676]